MNEEVPSTSCKQTISQENAIAIQRRCLNELQCWVKSIPEMNGRTDEDYLLMFLRGCKFNVEKTKKKITTYYETRKTFPKWLRNRDLSNENIHKLLQYKTTTAIIDESGKNPTVLFSKVSRDQATVDDLDDYVKLYSIILEVVLLKENTQKNGLIWICDCQNSPHWLVTPFFTPSFVKNLLSIFVVASPILLKGMHLINATNLARVFYTLVKPFLPGKFIKRLYLYSLNWSKLFDHVSIDLIPEEFGGHAAKMENHDDAFLKEILSYTEYFKNDDQFGFALSDSV